MLAMEILDRSLLPTSEMAKAEMVASIPQRALASVTLRARCSGIQKHPGN